MADFCNYCYDHNFGKSKNAKPDIDVFEIFDVLKPGFFQSCLCEGCNLRAISRTEDNQLKVLWDDSIDWEDYKDRSGRYEQ